MSQCRIGKEVNTAMKIQRLARLTGEKPLTNRREEEVRKVILALSRISYEAGRADAVRELEGLIS